MNTKRILLLSFCGMLLLNLLACSKGSVDNGQDDAPVYNVTISPTSASVATGDAKQFTATVTPSPNSGVTWMISGAGCTGDACGTIAQGLYTAPAAVPNPATVEVRAFSKDDTGKAATATVTVVPGIAVTVSPRAANVLTNGTEQFSAAVQNTSNPAVNWTLGGAGCSGAACGTITGAGLFTAPAAIPNPPTVTVTATAQADTRKTGTATVTVGGSALNQIHGPFAFLLSGFDADGAMHIAGSFLADGNGHLTGGVLDVNRVSGAHAQVAFTGTYTFGADRRGELVLTSALGTSKYRFALNAAATEGRVIEFDDTGTRCAGVFMKQDDGPFANSLVVGDYVLSLSGAGGSGDRMAAIGRVHANGNGALSDGLLDTNDGSAMPPDTALWSGSYAFGTNGRGTGVANIAGLGTIHFSVYMVSGSHTTPSTRPTMFFVSTDALSAATPMLSGHLSLQGPGPWSMDGWGGISVFALAGQVPAGGATAIAGIVESDRAGHLQNGRFDQNRAGVISGASAFTGTYNLESTGRGTAALQLDATHALPIVFYMLDRSQAVWLGTPGTDVLLGFFGGLGGDPGAVNNTSFSGDYVTGPLALAAPEMMVFSGVLNADGIGWFSGTQDISDRSGNAPGEQIAGTYSFAISGRGTASLAGGGAIALYMPAPNASLVAISVDPTDNHPVVLVIKR